MSRPGLGQRVEEIYEFGASVSDTHAMMIAMSESRSTLAAELHDEYRKLLGRLDRDREQAQRLRDLADQAADQVLADERLLRSMAEVLGISQQSTLDQLGGALRGQRLREVAVQVLRNHESPGAEVHYRDWYALLSAEGISVSGKDPLATFLSQVSRADGVEAVGRRSGRYRLLQVA